MTSTVALALRLARRLPEDAEQHRLVSVLSEHLSRNLEYLPPGSEGAARTLDEFVSGKAGGHCESFASALATMLRSLLIPCRVVTGYRSTSWDGEGRELAIGTQDAHAWVEVHDPVGGWYAVDPSPLVVGEGEEQSLWARLGEGFREGWSAVTGFDAEKRAAFLARLPGDLLARLAEDPGPAGYGLRALAVCLLAAGWVHGRRALEADPARGYRRAVRRARLRLAPGETPRELLSRAESLALPEERLAALAEATRRHERARYAA